MVTMPVQPPCQGRNTHQKCASGGIKFIHYTKPPPTHSILAQHDDNCHLPMKPLTEDTGNKQQLLDSEEGFWEAKGDDLIQNRRNARPARDEVPWNRLSGKTNKSWEVWCSYGESFKYKWKNEVYLNYVYFYSKELMAMLTSHKQTESKLMLSSVFRTSSLR